jgi:segregation and condensation protein B
MTTSRTPPLRSAEPIDAAPDADPVPAEPDAPLPAAEPAAAEPVAAEPNDAEPVPPQAGPAVSADPALSRGLEALLFLADEPLDVASLAVALETEPEDVEVALTDLARRSVEEQRGTEVRATAGGWRMYTAPAARPVIERWALTGRTGRLTQAALETLAVIAYKQPISRQEIGEIRGVNADGAVRSLVARGFVTEVGRDPGPGQAALFGTTRLLLERLGLGSLDELPPLTEFLPEAPAPDEPELGALKEIRRRLAAGGELTNGGLGGRSAAQTNTGNDDEPSDDEGDDVLPPPTAGIGGRREDEQMDALTDRLEQAARNAVGRLRAAVAAGDGRPSDDLDEEAATRDPADAEDAPDASVDAPVDAPAGVPAAEHHDQRVQTDG